MRDMINKSLELISFFIVFILFFSCTGEIGDETDSKTGAGGKVQIALQIPITTGDATSFTTRSEVDNESTIRNLTLFFFDSSGTKKFSTYIDLSNIKGSSSDVDMNRWANEKVITILNADILAQLSELRNVHVVANYGNISNIAKEADLNNIITNTINTDISSPTADKPLVMHGADLNHVFATNSKATVSLVRNVSKVQMTLTATDFTLGGKKISLAPESTSPSALSSVKVINQADRSFLVSKGSNPSRALTPPNITYFNGANTTVAVNSRTTPGITTFVSHINYINENLRESYSVETNATALILQIPYRIDGGEINVNNYYKILINNVDGNDKYKINRNTIYDITASISTLGGETDVSAVLVKGTLNVLPWDENTLTSDLTQTSLSVKNIQIGLSGVLSFETNALPSECSIVPPNSGSWLTTVSLDSENHQIRLEASSLGYTIPRAETFKLKVRNLTKIITVTQAPIPVTKGSILLSPRILNLPEKLQTARLTISPPTSSWFMMTEVVGSSIATCTPTSGKGDGILTFTNSTSSYGNAYYKFANLGTMEYDSIQVCNLYLDVPPSSSSLPIEISDKGTTNFDVKAFGGNGKWRVQEDLSWLTATNVGDSILSVTTTSTPSGTSRTGTITIVHDSYPSYTKQITVKQLNHIIIYDFDYLLLRYDWSGGGKDLDTATEFISTGLINVDNRALGYHLYGDVEWNGSSATNGKKTNPGTTGGSGPENDTNNQTMNSIVQLTDPSGNEILVWGGDNTDTNANESLYINVRNLFNNKSLPDQIYIDLYAIWYGTKSSNPIKVEITAYKDGTMKRYGDDYPDGTLRRNFHNDAGTAVYSNIKSPFTKVISKGPGRAMYTYRSSYTKVGRITFNTKTGAAELQ